MLYERRCLQEQLEVVFLYDPAGHLKGEAAYLEQRLLDAAGPGRSCHVQVLQFQLLFCALFYEISCVPQC